MAQAMLQTEAERKEWKIAFLAISALIVVIMPLLSHSYGQSADEWLQIEYGQHIYDYFFHGSKQALDYTNRQLQYSHQEYYGGLYDFPLTVLHHWLPKIDILTLRHFFNAIYGAVMMIFTGLLARKISNKWSVGLLALLFIIFSPRMFGESMNNPKDIPYAAGFIIGSYFFISYLKDFPNKLWRNAIGIAVGWGIAFGVRSAGGILLLAYMGLFSVLYYFMHKEFRVILTANNSKLLKRGIVILAVGVIIGYVVGLSCWPWGLQSPISHPLESLKGMTNREAYLRVLFEGNYYMSNNMPWYYEFKWILISNPLVVIAGVILGLVFVMRIKKEYGLFYIMFVVFAAFFPLLYMIYKHSTVYDTWRHVFFVYPFWAVLAALGWDATRQFIKKPNLQWLPVGVPLLCLLPAVIWTIRSHPNQYVYFNELVGGVKGAYGNYDLDYYQNTQKQQAEWLIHNVPHPPTGQKIEVRSNMSGIDNAFRQDSSWIGAGYLRYNERNDKAWDYYIDNPRFISVEEMVNNKWPPQNVVHTVSVDGVPLSVIIQQKSKAGVDAYAALQRKDFLTAAQKYAEYIKTDTTDDNIYANYAIALANTSQIDAAIGAMKKALDIDAGNAQYYSILAQLYHAKGDDANANQAAQAAQAINMKQQELQGEPQE